MHPTSGPTLLLRSGAQDRREMPWLEFRDPVEILEAREPRDIWTILQHAETAAESGLHAAGFVSYEAAPGFDSALTTLPPGDLPLAWFALFRTAQPLRGLPSVSHSPASDAPWQPSITRDEYRRAVAEIRKSIARGETYQANFTFRLRQAFRGDSWALFSRLVTVQPVGHAAYLDIGDHVICSASPELFFRLSGSRIICRPMKGTARRGLTARDDHQVALALYDSKKDRAENLMIVDMMRNDLGRIATPGSVEVTSLFELEKYTSVYQLTSEVQAQTSEPISEIFKALFPCASVTGAPKVKTMEILAALETSPRGIYTGAIGCLSPGRRAEFNVAIRTVYIDKRRERAEFGTGGGIVWDSTNDQEYRECRAKASVLTLERPDFELFETLRWDPGSEFFLLSRHLDRIAASADYFDYSFDRLAAQAALLRATAAFERGSQRVRLALRRDGEIRVLHDGPAVLDTRRWRLAIAPQSISTDDVFLFHKTTARAVYERARSSAPGYDDVLLLNERQQLTESSIANVALQLDGRRVTPPVEDGLLAGTFRQELIENGDLEVRTVGLDDLARSESVWLLNSVREWIDVESVDDLRSARAKPLWRNPSS